MLTRSSGYLVPCSGPAPAAVESLQRDGYVLLSAVFTGAELAALRADLERVFEEYPPDERGDPPEQSSPFRYEMLNRSAVVQRAIGHPRILEVVEPLLGEDCHVIANTAWWQQPGDNEHLGRFWHIDSGPHVPRDAAVPWDPRIPYPVFADRDAPLSLGLSPRSWTDGGHSGEPHIGTSAPPEEAGRRRP